MCWPGDNTQLTRFAISRDGPKVDLRPSAGSQSQPADDCGAIVEQFDIYPAYNASPSQSQLLDRTTYRRPRIAPSAHAVRCRTS